MDVLTRILLFLGVAAVLPIASNVFSHDIQTSAQRVCTWIIERAALRLLDDAQRDREEEWLADLGERSTTTEKYFHAIGCFFAAKKMQREYRRLTISLTLNIARVGSVPFDFSLGPPWFVAVARAILFCPRPIKLAAGSLLASYLALKLGITIACLGPTRVKAFQKSISGYREWGYKAIIRHHGEAIDVSEIAEIFVREPTKIPAVVSYLKGVLDEYPDR